MAVGPQITNRKNTSGFKFGTLERDHHTYIYKYEILVDFNLATAKVDCQTANLIPCQISGYMVSLCYYPVHMCKE